MKNIPAKTWVILIAGPVLFLAGIVGISLVLSLSGLSAVQVEERAINFMPHILLAVLSCLGVLALLLLQGEKLWSRPTVKRSVADVTIGALVGSLLAGSYIVWISPGLTVLQHEVGDYVAAGSVLPTISGNIGIFFIANVVLAPWAEETLYRGYAIPVLTKYIGAGKAVTMSCILFGLLHWPGGIWYVFLTGVLVGGALAGLFLWRKGLIAPFTAHLTLNVIEFMYAWRLQPV